MPGFSKLEFQVITEQGSVLLNSFNQLHHHGNILSDCTLSISGVEFPIHKCFLAACSPYFLALFTSDMREKSSSLIKIGGITSNTFQVVLDFLYSGHISLDESVITEVYAAAKLFQLDLLQKVCFDYFVNQLCTSNCIGIWKYARTYNDTFLEKSAWEYMVAHFIELVRCEEFLTLELPNVYKLLSSDDLEVSGEMDTYSAVVAWLNHNFTSRKQSIMSLVTCVRFPLLPLSSLNSLLTTDDLIASDRSLKDILIQAKNAQRLRSTKSRQKSAPSFRKTNLTPRRSRQRLSVVGGYSGNFVKVCETYDDITGSWLANKLEVTPCEHIHWIGVIGYRIYAIGGNSLVNMNLVFSMFTPHASSLLQTTALSKEWECEATLPSDCSSMEFCTMDDCIYGCGQMALDGSGDSVYGLIRYDPGTGNMEYLTTLPTPRVSMSFLGYDGILYLIGGMHPDTGAILSLFEGYNPNAGCWKSYPDMKIGRYHSGAAALDGRIYSFGGIGDDEGEVNTLLSVVECFSLDTLQWTSVEPLLSAKASIASCSWRGKIYCIGGETAEEVHTTDVFSFNPVDGVWHRLKMLEHSRLQPCLIVT